jgi:hypothetical protein
MIHITVNDLPLTNSEIDSLVSQYSVTKHEMQIALQHIEDSIDGTDEVDVRFLLHHMFNYASKLESIPERKAVDRLIENCESLKSIYAVTKDEQIKSLITVMLIQNDHVIKEVTGKSAIWTS